jgi:hypothetical protein
MQMQILLNILVKSISKLASVAYSCSIYYYAVNCNQSQTCVSNVAS